METREPLRKIGPDVVSYDLAKSTGSVADVVALLNSFMYLAPDFPWEDIKLTMNGKPITDLVFVSKNGHAFVEAATEEIDLDLL